MTIDPRSAEHQMSAQLPAPKTFAPSREDVLSNLAFFFGDPGKLRQSRAWRILARVLTALSPFPRRQPCLRNCEITVSTMP